jgi:hypothetical protein
MASVDGPVVRNLLRRHPGRQQHLAPAARAGTEDPPICPGYVLEFDQGGFRTDIGDMHFRVVGELFGAVSRLIGADGGFWLT